jgi:hypothetical protein
MRNTRVLINKQYRHAAEHHPEAAQVGHHVLHRRIGPVVLLKFGFIGRFRRILRTVARTNGPLFLVVQVMRRARRTRLGIGWLFRHGFRLTHPVGERKL